MTGAATGAGNPASWDGGPGGPPPPLVPHLPATSGDLMTMPDRERAHRPEDVLYHPDASVVGLADFGGGVAKGDAGIREVMAGYVGLAPTMDVTVQHVTHAGDVALVRSQWRIRGVDGEGAPIELHHHGMEVMRRAADGSWQFYIDHPWGADGSWSIDDPAPVRARP
jgi:ketosteroid isomerase-like protein